MRAEAFCQEKSSSTLAARHIEDMALRCEMEEGANALGELQSSRMKGVAKQDSRKVTFIEFRAALFERFVAGRIGLWRRMLSAHVIDQRTSTTHVRCVSLPCRIRKQSAGEQTLGLLCGRESALVPRLRVGYEPVRDNQSCYKRSNELASLPEPEIPLTTSSSPSD